MTILVVSIYGMYKVYCQAIRKYIIRVIDYYSQIEDNNKWLSLVHNYIVRTDSHIELESNKKIELCIRFMFDFLYSSEQLKIDNKDALLRVCINDEANMVRILDICETDQLIFCLNNFHIEALDNNGCSRRALLLFLCDPLEFIRRMAVKISEINDPIVESFLLGLKERCENMQVVHIKQLLIGQIDLVGDIKRIVMERYMGVTLDGDKIRPLLMNKFVRS